MQPEKYIKDLESSERRKKLLQNLNVSVIFLISFLVLGGLIHELSHLAVVQWKNCPHYVNWSFSTLKGLRAGVKPLCSLNPSTLIMFYSGGYLSTIVSGAVVMVGAIESGREEIQRYFSALGTGLLLSVLLGLGSNGDIASLLEIFGFEAASFPVVVFVMLGIFLSSLKGVKLLLELERQE